MKVIDIFIINIKMELYLSNFRCYTDKKFIFPQGVLLIDGPSGKGKTTILTAIKYALFGKVMQISTYGEKKTSVELIYKDNHIVRTNVPSRLLVTYKGKTLEDDAAQEHLYKIFGKQFELTSYMVQKGAVQFFTLSGAEKLKLLEQLSLLGEENIQTMKDTIQRDIKDKKRQTEKLENQIELLDSQLGTKPILEKKVGLKTLYDIQSYIQFMVKIKENWEEERMKNDRDVETYTIKSKEQRSVMIYRDSLLSLLRNDEEEIKRLILEKEKVTVDDTLVEHTKLILREHDEYTEYSYKNNELLSSTRLYNELVQKETEAHIKELNELEMRLIPSLYSLDELKINGMRLEKIIKIWKQLEDVSRCLQNEELNSEQIKEHTINESLFESYQLQLKEHDIYLLYKITENEFAQKQQMYTEIITKEQLLYETEIIELEAQIDNTIFENREEELQKCIHIQSLYKRLHEIKTELSNDKLKDIETRFDTTKKNKEKIEKFISSMEMRKCIHSCPQCNKSLLIHSNKIVSAEQQPISESDKKTEEKYITDLPKWNKQYETQYRLLISKEECVKEKDKLIEEIGMINEDKVIETIKEITSNIEHSKLVQHKNSIIQSQLLEKRKYNPITKYKDLEQQYKMVEVKLSMLQNGTECKKLEFIKEELVALTLKKQKCDTLRELHKEFVTETQRIIKLSDPTISNHINGYRMFILKGEWDESFRSYVDGKTEDETQSNLLKLQSIIEETVRIQQNNDIITKQISIMKLSNPLQKYNSMKSKINELEYVLASIPKGKECVTYEETRFYVHELISKQKEYIRIQDAICLLEKNILQKKSDLNVIWDDTNYEELMSHVMKRQTLVKEKLTYPVQQIKEYTEYYEQVKLYLAYRRKQEQINEKRILCAIYYSQLEQLESLFQHILQSEGICLEQFIRRVNKTMKWYLEKFFPDHSLQMELSTEKECKSGKIKNEICVQITQKQQVCDLKNLSGGEYDRCALAFMLTINELSYSPCLFLDESISSLDMSLSEEVLEVIKEKQTELGKLVLLISHQANTGFFDHVINL